MKFVVIKGKTLAVLVSLLLIGCLGLAAAGHNRTVAASAAARLLPIYCVETEENKISLGINCAWDNGDIEEILNALDKAQVKATFFILGQWCEKYPESVQEIAKRGHEIASHSYTHRDMNTLTREELAQEVTKAMAVLEETCGKKPELLRPPSGTYNDLAVEVIRGLGYYPIQWDVDTLDWKGLSAGEIVRRVTEKAQPGSIVLLHSGAENTSIALPELLRCLQESGVEIVPVGELIYKGDYTIDVQGRQHPAKS